MADDTWKRRFSAPRIDEVRWAGVAPDRLGVVSTESGSSQAWAWDVATLGGSPMDLPALYQERNPMTYVDQVRAPVLLIAGEHDSRCPLGQVMVYAHALQRRGHPVELHLYPGGHHANDVAEQIRQATLAIEFFGRCLADRTAIDSMIR